MNPIIGALSKLHSHGVAHSDICMEKIAIRISKKKKVTMQLFGFEHAVNIKAKAGLASVKALCPPSNVAANSTIAPEIVAG